MTKKQALNLYLLMTPVQAAGVRVRVDAAIRAGETDIDKATVDAVRQELAGRPLP
jgi:hypothetical protein